MYLRQKRHANSRPRAPRPKIPPQRQGVEPLPWDEPDWSLSPDPRDLLRRRRGDPWWR